MLENVLCIKVVVKFSFRVVIVSSLLHLFY